MSIFFHLKIKLTTLISNRFSFEVGKKLNAGVLSQTASSKHALLITKSALVINKKVPSLSANHDFAPHEKKGVIVFIISNYSRDCTALGPITISYYGEGRKPQAPLFRCSSFR